MSEEHLPVAFNAALDDLLGWGAEVADPRTGALVEPDTMFWAGSTAKGVDSRRQPKEHR
jgi:hypothetical protein